VTTQAYSIETERGRNTLEADAPSPHPAEGVAPSLKQVASHARSERCRGPGVASSLSAGSSAARTNLWGRMTGTAVYEIRRARTREELAAALALRHDVFCVEQGVPVYEELDGRDGEGVHLVAVSDGALLATCRLLFVGPTVQFSRLAVRTSARRQGIATALLALADEETRAGGARRLVLHAQTYARSLYEAAGYEPRGRIFMEAGIEHIAMEKILS
jgi:predicted GNAT family N-acyltransferase